MIQRRRGLRLLAFVTTLIALAYWPGDATAANCSTPSHDLILSAGTVTPSSGSTATTFRFSVTYADNAGCSPDRIVVVVNGVGTFKLTYAGGDLKTGAVFARSIRLPAGNWTYRFEATSGTGAGELTVTLTNVDPTMVLVSAPTPPPTPAPTPPPTPAPTPPPTPAPTPPDAPTPSPTSSPPVAIPSGPFVDQSGAPAGSAPPDASASEAPAGIGAGSPPSGSPGSPGVMSWTAAFDLIDVPRPWLALAVSSVGTAAGLALFILLSGRVARPWTGAGGRLVFAAAARNRRRPEPPLEPAPASSIASAVSAPTSENADPTWSGSITRPPIVFSAPPEPGVDRCRVVSRLVPLRSEPGEFSGSYSMRLDPGDEVDVLRQDGPYCLVRTPSGAEGWLPGLTLTGASPTTPTEVPDDER